MTIGFVAFHYPQPEYFEEFTERVSQVAEILRRRPGCRSARAGVSTDGDAVVSTVEFDTRDALDSAFAASGAQLAALTVFDERERKPRQVINLQSR